MVHKDKRVTKERKAIRGTKETQVKSVLLVPQEKTAEMAEMLIHLSVMMVRRNPLQSTARTNTT